MINWKRNKLSDILEIKYGKDHKHLANGKIPLYGSGGIMRYVDTSLYEHESILIPRKGTLSNLFYLNKPFWSVDTMFYTKIKKGNCGKYLYYLLKSIDLASMNVGSAVPSLTTEVLNKLEVSIPESLETQTRIASILSALDDKIELNRQTNKTLEQIAQTLFKKYFVDDIDPDNLPDGWVRTLLDEFVTTTTGYSYKGTELQPSKNALVTLKNFDRNGGFRLDGFKEYVGGYKEKQLVSEGDLAVAHTDVTQNAELIGNPILIVNPLNYEKLIISTDLVKVESKYDWLSKEYLYYLMRDIEFKNHCLAHTNGTTVLHLSKSAIPTFKFNMPDKETVSNFTNVVKPLIIKMNNNIRESKTLIKLRDSLLPKLMSGEIDV